jgi:hypothetical protein
MKAKDEIAKDTLIAPPNFSVSRSMLGSASLLLPQELNFVGLWTLSHQNVITILSVLRKQTSPVLSQVLKSPVGPIVERLLELPIPNNAEVNVVTLVHVELDYPWIVLRFNIPMNHHSAILDVRYEMKKGKVELHYTGIGHHMNYRWTRAFMLASVATYAIDGLSFIPGHAPKHDRLTEMHTFAWGFQLPTNRDESSLKGYYLVQFLKQIIRCSYPNEDSRFNSPISGESISVNSIFKLAIDCCAIAGKKVRLVDLLPILQSDVLQKYILNHETWLNVMGTYADFDDAFELLTPDCLDYLKNVKGFKTDTIFFNIVVYILWYNHDKEKVIQFVKDMFNPTTVIPFLENVIGSLSAEKRKDFFLRGFPEFMRIFPDIYPKFHSRVLAYLQNRENCYFTMHTEWQVVCYYLTQWDLKEREIFLDRLTSVARLTNEVKTGIIVHYMSCPETLELLVKLSVKNESFVAYVRGIFVGCLESAVSVPWFSESIQNRVARIQNAQAEFIKSAIAKGASAEEIILIMHEHSRKAEVIHALEKYLTRESVEGTRNKRDSFAENEFLSKTLPLLYSIDSRWLEYYRTDLLNIMQLNSTLYTQWIPTSLIEMITDLLESSDKSLREEYYHLSLKSKRFTNPLNTKDNQAYGILFIHMMMCCRDLKMQKEMVEFLIHGNRWDLLMCGAFLHGATFDTLRRNSKIQANTLCREQFTPEKIRQIWKKEKGWEQRMPCIMMKRDDEIKETALDLLTDNLDECHELLMHQILCLDVDIDEIPAVVFRVEKLSDQDLKDFLLKLSPFFLGKLICLICNDDSLWNRFQPLLLGISPVPQTLKILDQNMIPEKYQSILEELGWDVY